MFDALHIFLLMRIPVDGSFGVFSPASQIESVRTRRSKLSMLTSQPFKNQVKLNTDESPSVATEYGIRSIPTVMIFKGGQKLDTVIGAVPKSTLTGTIEKYL